MLLPIKWLKDYVKVDLNPKELGEILMFKSFEVEAIKESGGFDNIVVGKILEIKKHPNADRLKIVEVDIGENGSAPSSDGVTRRVICGGTNLREGMLIAFAKVGAKIRWHGKGELAELQPAEIRGVKSMGMICSASEIGLAPPPIPSRDSSKFQQQKAKPSYGSDFPKGENFSKELVGGCSDKFPHDEREILDLTSTKAKVGTPLADIFGGHAKRAQSHAERGGGETVLELSITPNRPDCLSILGLAREIGALTGQKADFPKNKFREVKTKASEMLEVKVENKNLCPQYCARVIKGVKIAPSPKWLAERLESVGLRPINNVVDITNFVLFEMGQPLHAFDFKKLASGKAKAEIIVRKAKKGEKILALDEVEYNLNESNLVIADGKRPVAIAGVIGGQETAVDEKTRDIILESAIFEPKSVRLTSKNLGVRTESSMRFERSFDPLLTEEAINRAADLIVELGGGEVLKGIVRVGQIKSVKKAIKISVVEINSLIGIEIPQNKIISILTSLGCVVNPVRNRISNGARKSGKNLPRRVKAGLIVIPPSWRLDLNLSVDIVEEVARVYGYNKLPEKYLVGELYPPQKDKLLELEKNVRGEMLKMGFDEVYSSSFYGEKERDLVGDREHAEVENPMSPEEKYFRASLLPNLFKNILSNENNFDEIKIFEIGKVYYDNKEETRIAGAIFLKKEKDADKYRKIKGVLEKLSEIMKMEDLKIDFTQNGVHYFEFSIPSQIISKTSFKPSPKFPGITRDLSVIVPKQVRWLQIEEIVKKAAGDLLSSVELFDIYEDSLAFHINFSHPERTLRGEEVDAIISKIIKNLENLGIKIRK